MLYIYRYLLCSLLSDASEGVVCADIKNDLRVSLALVSVLVPPQHHGSIMQQDGNISDVVIIIIVASHDDHSALLTILNKKMHLTCVDLRTIFHYMIST